MAFALLSSVAYKHIHMLRVDARQTTHSPYPPTPNPHTPHTHPLPSLTHSKKDRRRRHELKLKARVRAAQLAQAEGIADAGTEEGLFSLVNIKVWWWCGCGCGGVYGVGMWVCMWCVWCLWYPSPFLPLSLPLHSPPFPSIPSFTLLFLSPIIPLIFHRAATQQHTFSQQGPPLQRS